MSSSLSLPKSVEYLLSPQAIRDQSQAIFESVKNGKGCFLIDESKLELAANEVVDRIREQYPDLEIPFHSRLRHFEVGGIDRFAGLMQKIDSNERLKAGFDLVITSVLLDAGAGSQWKYQEPSSGKTFSRSEGLGVASFDLFQNGAFSHDSAHPYQVTTEGLDAFSFDEFEKGFQLGEENPLEGARGRFELVKTIAKVMKQKPEFFSGGRLGSLSDWIIQNSGDEIDARLVLTAVQLSLGEIWPGRIEVEGYPLGDVWEYAPLAPEGKNLVSFHKLSQWLSYSLIEVLQKNGQNVIHLNELTGLAEYRNGGLFVDTGVLSVKSEYDLSKKYSPDSELIIEWRALTLALIEKIADQVRAKIGKTQDELPMVKILEGGTWAAGRKLAFEKREGGNPPIQIKSDGTVF